MTPLFRAKLECRNTSATKCCWRPHFAKDAYLYATNRSVYEAFSFADSERTLAHDLGLVTRRSLSVSAESAFKYRRAAACHYLFRCARSDRHVAPLFFTWVLERVQVRLLCGVKRGPATR